jgi:PAS domain S-box-containing protein
MKSHFRGPVSGPPSSIIDTIRPCITLANRKYVYEAVNRSYCEAHGKRPEDIIGRTVADVWGQDVFETAIRKNFDACFGGREVRDEGWVNFASIGSRYCEIFYSPYSPGGEGITHAVVVTYDITDRKSVEEALVRSERRFRALSEASLEAIIFVEDGIVVDANRAFSDLFGYDDSEIRGRRALDFMARDRRDEADQRMAMGIEGLHETVGLRKDGTTFPIEVNAREAEGKGRRLRISALRDLTDRKRWEEELKSYRDHLEKLVEDRTLEIVRTNMALQASEEKYRDIFENALEGIFQTTTRGRVLNANAVLAGIYGFENGQVMIGASVGLWDEPYVDGQGKKTLLGLLRRTGVARDFEMEVHASNGLTRWVVVNVRAVRTTQGRTVFLQGSVQDISERKRIQQALQDSERRLDLKSQSLEETNTALKFLLKQRESDKRDMEQIFLANVKELVLPYVERLKKTKLNSDQAAYCSIVERNLREIVAPFVRIIRTYNFTPKELEIISLVKEGKTTKEIAEILRSSKGAVDVHRNNIRRKLGLRGKNLNLRAQLLDLPHLKQ